MMKEHPKCEYYMPILGGHCNVCAGNEPYRCARAKEERLCHIETGDTRKIHLIKSMEESYLEEHNSLKMRWGSLERRLAWEMEFQGKERFMVNRRVRKL